MTRRGAIGRMTLGAVSFVASARSGLACPTAKRSAGVYLGREANGSEIWQVTTEAYAQSNIYCETPYCDAASRYFVYQRRNPQLTKNSTELMVVELGSWKQHRLDTASGLTGLGITPGGVLYYLKRAAGNCCDLMRASLAEGRPERVYQQADGSRNRSLGTVTADERYYATGTRPGQGWDRFGIVLVDLQSGTESLLDEDPYILNAHPQFDPASHQLMIQHNRGGKYSPDGKRLRLVGPEGATLYLLSVPDGRRTTLSVGKPFTTPCTGHEAWIGKTQEMLLSVSARDDFAPEKGNLLGVRAGEPARVVAKGYRFNHVGVSRCGRLFSCDDWQGSYKIVVGSTRTGRTAVVCESKTSPDGSQNTHPHAYLTPDLKWVIFNSNRSGFPHIHAASVPEDMVRQITTT
jgi:hypothetical protein